jgi:microcystin-dependent protein
MPIETGNKIRWRGVYRLYRNEIPVSETPYNLLDAFGSTPAITIEELELMATPEIEARAAAMIEAIGGKCVDFKIINDIIYKSNDCEEEEDDTMIGQIIDFGGAQNTWDAEKWRECNGDVVAITDFPELYAMVGRRWTADTVAAGYFAIPDLRGRVALGFDAATSATPRNQDDITSSSPQKTNYAAVGNTGGATSVVLRTNQLPDFTMTLPGQVGGDNDDMSNKTAFAGGDKSATETSFNFNLPVQYSRGKAQGNYGVSHENRPPYAVVYKLIRYK